MIFFTGSIEVVSAVGTGGDANVLFTEFVRSLASLVKSQFAL